MVTLLGTRQKHRSKDIKDGKDTKDEAAPVLS